MKGIVFGPVASRRLGKSLGVNIVSKKICSLDCLYCEVCKTNTLTLKRAPYIPVEKILAEFSAKYPLVKNKTDVITITGMGEPTLNSHLKEIIAGIKELSEHPVALLTNSTLLSDSNVAEALMQLDIIVPSLDAVTQDIFEIVDKPAPGLKINEIIKSLISFSCKFSGKLYLEILLVKGINDSPAELLRLAEMAKQIRHTKIQICTVFRPPAWEGAERLSDSEIKEICMFFSKQGLNVEFAGAFNVHASKNVTPEIKKQLLESLLCIRPVTVQDISEGIGISAEEAELLIASIDSVQIQNYNGEIYYCIR